jgi:hypothetical protein
MPLIALTGGPGSGKTAVITALRERGYDCVPQSARAVIQERLNGGFSPRPPAREFAEAVLPRDIQQYAVADARQPVFFDRCILDALSMFDQFVLIGACQVRDDQGGTSILPSTSFAHTRIASTLRRRSIAIRPMRIIEQVNRPLSRRPSSGRGSLSVGAPANAEETNPQQN